MSNEPTTERQLSDAYRWDYFLYHAGADSETARKFKDALPPPERVFLDKDDIPPGAVWSTELPTALRSSLIYVFLISGNPDDTGFNYLRVEIDHALSLWRKNQNTHRVVPVYLNRNEVPAPDEAPLGLGSIQGFAVPDPNDLSEASTLLRNALDYVKPLEAKRIEYVAGGVRAASKVNEAKGLGGIFAANTLVGPLFYTLLGLFVLVTLGIVACAVMLSFGLPALPALTVLALMWTVLLAGILWLTSFSAGNVKGG
jgi:hypothetical protein